ncbi:10077_t:CDS:2 [Paraglomus occultum]|uniref:10077_t:CDS:1 n=1 Tax=Paraglomus occultum TaxID=144539 RepID=A0A9N9ATG7_9GLOM|nr:10077_t:CDS:2 [Paraglomus occultum]
MKILSCKIRPLGNSTSHKVPITVILLESGANCNIIGRCVGNIHEIKISILSQDRKWEQVVVTDVFVTNKPEPESVLILGQPWFQENAIKVDFSNKTFTLLDGTDIQLVIGPKIPPPTQLNQSVDDYFKMIKVYATTLDIDLENQDLKETFFNGLSRDNKKEVIRFGFKKPLNKIVVHLNRISSGYTDIQNFQFGNLSQEEYCKAMA